MPTRNAWGAFRLKAHTDRAYGRGKVAAGMGTHFPSCGFLRDSSGTDVSRKGNRGSFGYA